MALGSGTFSLAREHVPIGFSGPDEQALSRFFGCAEADAGLRSATGAQLDKIFGVSVLGIPHLAEDAVIDLVDRSMARESRGEDSSRSVYLALKRMLDAGGIGHVVVIWRLFGDRRPGIYYPEVGEQLSRIADLTEVASAAREEIALEVGESREQSVSKATITRVTENRADFEKWFWIAARKASLLEAQGDEAGAAVRRAEMACWLRGFEDGRDGVLAARISALASADREVTCADAVRIRMMASERKAFGEKLKSSCKLLRRDAGDAYRDHKRPR